MRHYPVEVSPSDPVFLDFETVGFAGFPVLLQYAVGDGPVVLHNIAYSPVWKTLEIIEDIFTHTGGIVGFNLTFDYYHAIKCYNVLRLVEDKDEWVEDVLEEIEYLEPKSFQDMVCLNPPKTLDLMLFCRSTSLQMCMNRKDLKIRRVAFDLAEDLARELNQRVSLPGILFSRKANPSSRFMTQPIKYDDGTIDTDFANITLKFAPSTALKAVCKYLNLTKKERLLFEDVEIDPRYRPEEYQFAPFAFLIKDHAKKWTTLYPYHAEHWTKTDPKVYAEDDIHDTRALYKYFMAGNSEYGTPEWGTVDNSLVAMVANTRFKGFEVDLNQINVLKKKAVEVVKGTKYNFRSPAVCRKYMTEFLDPEVEMILTDPQTGKISTKGDNLKAIAKLTETADICDCYGEGCDKCIGGLIPVFEYVQAEDGTILKVAKKHPAAIRANEILDFRHMEKEIQLYDKLLLCGKIFPDVNIIGAKSSRMSGSGGFNFQGVKKAKYVRKAFPLKYEGEFLGIGDLDAFEVCIMEAVYADPALRADLLSGKKIHALFEQALYPDKSYEEILESSGYPDELNLYSKGKACLFAMLYGATEAKISETATISIEQAREAFVLFGNRYPKWREEFDNTVKNHSALVQAKGIGSKIEWVDPKMYAETLFGFKRYFDIDYSVARTLFDLAQDIPKSWHQKRGTVMRRDKEQTIVGSIRSALYAGAFGLISAVIRQAQNHRIQGSGAYVTKKIQKNIWDLQPIGIHPLQIRAIQVHDEVITCGDRELMDTVDSIVQDTVRSFSDTIPLIAMGWAKDGQSWAEK